MRTFMLSIMIVIFIGGSLITRSLAVNSDDTRQIQIEVRVRDYHAKPVDQVLLGVFDGQSVRADVATDETGNATIELELSEDISRIELRHAFAYPSSFLDSQEQVALSKRMTDLRRKYFIDRSYPIHLNPHQDTYHIEIVFREAVVVTGIIVGKDDEPIGHVVYGPNPLQFSDATGRKRFLIRGARKAADVTLLASFRITGSVTPLLPIHLTAEQTRANVDLGLLVMPEINRDAQLDVYLSNPGVFRGTRIGVTFIRTDGKMLFAVRAYGAIDSERERIGEVIGNPIALPAGEYYVAPGSALGSPPEEVWALVVALHQGRDVDEFGVHKITLEKDKRQTFNFDLTALQEPIRKMMGE